MIEIKNKSGEVIYTYDGETLSGADLRYVNLSGADWRYVNLSGADLRDADLRDAILINADLRDAILINADLSGADLRDAILINADLSGADISGADISGADLRDADLINADLRDADLSGANTEFGILQNIMQVSNIGSRNDTTVIYHTEQGIFIKCGCFKGSLAEFEEKVKETHKGNDHEKAYLAMIELVKVRFQNK